MARALERPGGGAEQRARVPFPGPIDAPLAPLEECTPGEFPTSTPSPSPTPTPVADAEPVADSGADPDPAPLA